MINHLEKVSTDLASGWGIDTYFINTKYPDPWANDCLINLIDMIINYNSVVYPLPSDVAKDMIYEGNIPYFFQKTNNLIKPYTKRTAQDVYSGLNYEQIETEYNAYLKQATEIEPKKFREWINQHMNNHHLAHNPVLQYSNPINIPGFVPEKPEFFVEPFLKSEDHLLIAKNQLKLDENAILYSFDTWMRTIAYDEILSKENIIYFPHKYRSHAFNSNIIRLKQPQEYWSWGRYFTYIMTNYPKYKNMAWLIEHIEKVRDITKVNNATWNNIKLINDFEQRKEILTNIAIESELPAKIKNDTYNKIKKSCNTATLAATAITNIVPESCLILLSVSATNYAINQWKGNIPGNITSIRIIRGNIEWPELLKNNNNP